MASPKEVSVIVRAVDQLTAPVNEMNSRMKGFVEGVRGLFTGLTAGFAALGIVEVLKSVVGAALDGEKSMARLDAAVTGIGISYGSVRPELEAYLTKLQETTRFSKEDGAEALTRLITKTGQYQQSLDDMQLVANVAAFKQVSLADAADLVAKAHEGSGRVAKEFNLVVKEGSDYTGQLTAKLQGFEATSRTTGDQIGSLNNLWTTFKVKLGEALIGGDNLTGGVTSLQRAVKDLTTWVTDNSDTIGGWVGTVVDGVKLIGGALHGITQIWGNQSETMDAIIDHEKQKIRDQVTALDEARAKVNAIYNKKQDEANAAARRAEVAQAEADKVAKEAAKKAAAEALAAAKKHHEDLQGLQDTADKSALQMLDANERAYAEVERTFREKMKGMTAADYKAAEGLLKQTLDNMLLVRAGYTNAVLNMNTQYVQGGRPLLEFQKSEQTGVLDLKGVTSDFTEVLRKHGQVLTEEQTKTLASAASREVFRQGVVSTAYAIANGADQMLKFIDALGLADEATTKVVGGIANLAEGIGKVASGNIAGGLVEGISGLSGVIAGLFGGESESARQVRLSLEKTRDELERHRQTLGDLIALSQPGAQVVNLQGGINEVLAAFKAAQEKGGVAGVLKGVPDDFLKPILAKRGLSMDDLEKLAKDLGIDLRGGVAGGFVLIEQLQNLLKDIDARDSGFAQTFEGQLDKLTQRWNIIGANAGQKLGDLVDLAGDPALGSSALAGLKNFNLNTDKGRTDATSFLTKLLDRGDLTNDELGGLNLSKFRDLLGQIAGLIRDVSSSGDLVSVPGPTVTPNPDHPPINDGIGGPTPNPQPSSDLPAGVGVPPSDYLGSIIAGLAPLEGDFAHLIDVQVAALTRLTSIDALLGGALGAPGSSSGGGGPGGLGDSYTTFEVQGPLVGQVTLNGVSGDLRQVSDEIIRQISIGLAREYQDAQRAKGLSVIR